MIELHVLGASEVRRRHDGGVRRVELPPKRLALLSYLALARPRGHQRRDILSTMFWPDADQARARNALNQALHAVRRALGRGAVVSGGREEVGLAEAKVACDAVAFELHLQAGRPEAALDLYGGDLMQGLYPRGAHGFERWLDAERTRYGRQARDGAARLSEAADASGNLVAAARWLERALEIVPTDETLARRLIDVLHRAGDRTGAIAAYEPFARYMEAAYQTPPSAETRAVLDEVRTPRRPAPAVTTRDKPIRSIAVLPLHNLGADETRAYSADAMTEALVTELGRVRSLRVISHQSVQRFKGSRLALREIARTLDVEALVEGSVLEAGGRVRVTAQLMRADPERHLWADAYEHDARDVISMHRELTRAIASAVAAALSADEEHQLSSTQPVNPAAYHAYLRAWMKHSTLLPVEMAQAIPLYREAIELDPSFAPARANLAVMHNVILSMGEVPIEVGLPAMREAADLAMDLDNTLALSHTAQGLVRMHLHDWPGAEDRLRRATTIATSLPVTHATLAAYLLGMARFDEAIEAAGRSRRLDPLAPYANWLYGWCLYFARRPAESILELRRVLELFADYPVAWVFLAGCHYQLGERDATLAACNRSLELLPDNPMTLGYVTHMLARIGERDRANEVMAQLESHRTTRQFVAPFYAATALCGLGRTEEALDQLDLMRAEASTTGWLLGVDPLLDPLRGEARFDATLERLGLKQRTTHAG